MNLEITTEDIRGYAEKPRAFYAAQKVQAVAQRCLDLQNSLIEWANGDRDDAGLLALLPKEVERPTRREMTGGAES